MSLMGGISRLLKDRRFWYITVLLVIAAALTFVVESFLFGNLSSDEHEWHSVFVAVRNFLFLGIVCIIAWKYGFTLGLAAILITGLTLLPHVITETIIEGYHPEVLSEYAVIVPVGVVFAWLIGARKQMEDKLKDSEKRYRRLFETAQDAILILDGDSGKIIDANPFVKDLLGYTMEELVGKNLWEIGEIKDIPAGRMSYQELSGSGYKRWANLPLVSKDGKQISVEVVANAYQVDHTRIIQCNIRDMTVANLATEALKTLNEDLKVAQRLTKIGNWKWIIATSTVTWSDELCRINGWDPEVPAPPFAEMERFYTPEGWKRLNEAVAKALDTGGSYELELTQIQTDGTKITTFSRGEADFDANGKIVSLHGTVQDITERKQAETTMHFQSQILQNMSEGVQVTRVIDQVIVFTNPPFETMFGYGPGELFGKHVSVLNASSDEQTAQDTTSEIIKAVEENGTWQGDVHNVRKDGSTLWCRASVSTFEHNIYGRVWIAVHQDITEHKIAEEELLRLRQAVETSGEAIFMTDREGVITYINPEFTKLYGYSAAEVIGKTTPRVLKGGKTRPEEYAAFWNELISKRVVKGELVNKTKDGRLITVEGSANPILNMQGDIVGFLAIQSDITERKETERMVQQSEEKFRSLAEQSPNMVFINQAGRVVYANHLCEEITGYKREELYAPDFDFLTLIVPEDRAQIMVNFRRHMASQQVPPSDYTLITRDGTRINVILTTRLIDYEGGKAIIGIMTDVTERKKAEETLKLQADLLDAELDSVYLHDFEGNIIYINRAAYLTHGYTREELLSMKLSQLDDPESARLIAPRLKEVSEKGQATFEVNHRHKNGSLIPMEVHTSLIEVGGKKLIMSVAHDITERNKLQEQLISQDRLASIGQLVSGVAHEINNPLVSVIGYSQLLLKRELPDDVMADLKVVNDEAQRTARIVRNLLTFARKQPEGKELVDTNEQIQRVLVLRHHEQEVNNIQVVTRFTSDLPQVTGNASQLQQVFFNIIINAEFFMIEAHQKGNLTVTTERVGKTIRISIADDGPGIKPEHMNRLFTPFFTTKDVGKGTGLGLSICHGIVTEHGGRIYAESEPGKGATFIVELPIPEETTSREAA